MSTGAKNSSTSLDELMVAMDVVDTLRHAKHLTDRELDFDGRRERLLSRLRELYDAQGIDVPDHILEEGISALEEERFQYAPPPKSWRTRIARRWVKRKRWVKRLRFFAFAGTVIAVMHLFTEVLPNRNLKNEIPQRIDNTMKSIQSVSRDKNIVQQASSTAQAARVALKQDKLDNAKTLVSELEYISNQLTQQYIIRVISRSNQNSGVWRTPPNNPAGRNFYLVVEAIDKNNQVVELDIVNEENNQIERKKTWGLRVDEQTFYKVAADKRDDGIIQSNQVGEKPVGYLTPRYSIPTSGATITNW